MLPRPMPAPSEPKPIPRASANAFPILVTSPVSAARMDMEFLSLVIAAVSTVSLGRARTEQAEDAGSIRIERDTDATEAGGMRRFAAGRVERVCGGDHLVLWLDCRADIGGREDGEDESLDRDHDPDLEKVENNHERNHDRRQVDRLQDEYQPDQGQDQHVADEHVGEETDAERDDPHHP